VTYRRRGHAEHDNQSYVPEGEAERWAAENDPLDRYVRVLIDREKTEQADIDAIDARALADVDAAAAEALRSPKPEGRDALSGVHAGQAPVAPHWYRA
jgi:TPP-dependent pyruvate/acetoin dehydrogenase alpha subunit